MTVTTEEASSMDCLVDPINHFCATVGCMGWRWHEKTGHEPGAGHRRISLPKDEWTGYCGLAGKP